MSSECIYIQAVILMMLVATGLVGLWLVAWGIVYACARVLSGPDEEVDE